uniref:Uncharacterized protein n=1 Tax=Arundo donax TaxID=35708 RepID=A0A0A9C7K5_ARUDO
MCCARRPAATPRHQRGADFEQEGTGVRRQPAGRSRVRDEGPGGWHPP